MSRSAHIGWTLTCFPANRFRRPGGTVFLETGLEIGMVAVSDFSENEPGQNPGVDPEMIIFPDRINRHVEAEKSFTVVIV